MLRILKLLLVLAGVALGCAWRVFELFAELVGGGRERDWVERYEVPHERKGASFTMDGRRIIG